MTPPAVALVDIDKAFPGVRALDRVSFDVRPGEVHALMGENGAGKSTLMKIAAGVLRPDAGTVEVGGRPVQLTSPRDAARAGIQVVFQELAVLDNLDVAHNLMVGDLPVRRGAVDRKALYARAAAVLSDLGIDLDPRARVELLSAGRKQLLEIARAVAKRPRVLVLDEPSSSLGRTEEQVLFALVERLRRDGVGVAYISHRMSEVFALADRVTVLRDGRHVLTADASTMSRADLIRSMVGRELVTSTRVAAAPGRTVLMARELVRAPLVAGVDLELRAGEVLGLAGLLGSGRSETARLLAGVDRPAAGVMTLDGRPFSPPTVRAAVRAGVCYLPEDRKLAGLVLGMSIQDNIALPQLRALRRRGLVSRRAIAERAATWVTRLSIRTPDTTRAVGVLSGGNQQKVALAKWLATGPRVVLLDEPTRGVDVGAKAEISALIRALAAQGAAVLVISSELPEVLSVSDRIAVMASGRIAGTVPAAGATEESLLELAFTRGSAADGEPVVPP